MAIVISLTTKEIKKFMQSKPEIYNFIVRNYQGYLPPYADCTPGKYGNRPTAPAGFGGLIGN